MKYLICILTATVFLFGCKSDEIGPDTPAPRIKILSFSPVENSFGNLTFEILDNPLDKDGNTFANFEIRYSETNTNPTKGDKLFGFYPGWSVVDAARIDGKPWETPPNISWILKLGQFKIGVPYQILGFNKKYYAKAFSTTSYGKTYSSETFTFNTPDFSIPKVIKVNLPTSISSNSANLSGWFELSGVSYVGVCLSESPNVTISDKKGDELKSVHDGTNNNYFIHATTRNILTTGLKSKTKYYYKMYAKNEKGIVLSEENSFTTL
jgi:hypothetical protein